MSDVFAESTLTQKATYWARTGQDGYGKPTYAAPVVLDCRWLERHELFIDQNGQETRSTAVAIVDRDLAVDGYLIWGESAELTPPADAWEIRGWEKTPNIEGTLFVRKAVL